MDCKSVASRSEAEPLSRIRTLQESFLQFDVRLNLSFLPSPSMYSALGMFSASFLPSRYMLQRSGVPWDKNRSLTWNRSREEISKSITESESQEKGVKKHWLCVPNMSLTIGLMDRKEHHGHGAEMRIRKQAEVIKQTSWLLPVLRFHFVVRCFRITTNALVLCFFRPGGTKWGLAAWFIHLQNKEWAL